MSILLDDKENERLHRLCEEAYPGRAGSIIAKLADAARWVYWPNKSDADNLQAIKDIAASNGAAFTRVTPSAQDYLAWAEKDRTSRGLSWGPTDRMAALRKAQAMTPDELLDAVPTDFKAPTAAPAPVQRAPANETERLDAEIQARTGKDPRQMYATERQRWHNSLKAELAPTPAPKAADLPPPDPLNPERWRQRVNMMRAAAAAKK